MAWSDPFGLSPDTLHFASELLERNLTEERRTDATLDSVLTVLEQSPEHFTYIGTEVVPSSDLHHPGFTGKTFVGGQDWSGYEEYQSFCDARNSGCALVSTKHSRYGEVAGHEGVHLLQINDGRPFENSRAEYQRLFKHFTPWAVHP